MEKPSDKYIPYYFVAFFVALTCLLGSFVYIAVDSYQNVKMERY
jgi:hypothetical protein